MASDIPVPPRRRRHSAFGSMTSIELACIAAIVGILALVIGFSVMPRDNSIKMPGQCKGCISCTFNGDGTVTKTGCR